MPTELDVPRQVEQPSEARPELFQTPPSPFSDVMVPMENMAPAYLYQQPPVRARDRDERKKQRNWLVLKVEEQKDNKEGTREKDSRATPVTTEDDTGWGWLASAVLRQQEAQKKEAQAVEEEEASAGSSVLATEALMQRATATQSGLMVTTPSPANVALVSAPAVKPLLDAQERDGLSRVAIDEGPALGSLQPVSRGERQVSAVPKGGSVASTLSGLAEPPVFTTDPMKREGSGTPGSVLPRTAALLSPKPSPDMSAKPSAPAGMTAMFQVDRPKPAFDLSMPSASVSGSPFSRPDPASDASGVGGFFSAPRESGLGAVPSRAAGSGLLMPMAPAGGGVTPLRSTLQTEQTVPAPSFPTAPSWRK